MLSNPHMGWDSESSDSK